MVKEKIEILDTTLRDGEQTTGVSYTGFEKLSIVKSLLREAKVSRIEVASARVSKGEFQSVRKITQWANKNDLLSKVEVLGFVDNHLSVNWISDVGGAVINLLTKGSLKHLEGQLKKTPEQHLEDITAEVDYARQKGIKVNIYLEDWSNGMQDSPEYVHFITKGLTQLPIERIMLPDTLGVLTPKKTTQFCREMRESYPDTHLDFHAHNDYDLAIANVMAAVEEGVDGLHVTVNGLGERAGNAPLASVIGVLHDHVGVTTSVQESSLHKLSKLVEIYSGIRIPCNKPLVGDFVFTQVAGIHADGDSKNKLYFNRLLPERFGRIRLYALGKTSGKANIKKNIEALGYRLKKEELSKVTQRVVELSDKKEHVTQEDLPYIIADVKEMATADPSIQLLSYSLSTVQGLTPVATIRISINDIKYQQTAEGDGQFDAFFKAIKYVYRRLKKPCPKLLDYFVSIPPGGRTDALVETSVTWKYKEKEFKTKGLDADQTESAIQATMRMLNIMEDEKKDFWNITV